MSLTKKYAKRRNTCKVTFSVPRQKISKVDSIFLVGEFNGWDTGATPMKKLRNGNFSVQVPLEAEKEYQFRYLINGGEWVNDQEADKYTHSNFGDCDNSVVIV